MRTTEVDDAYNRVQWLLCAIRHAAAIECLEARDRAIQSVTKDKK